ncbi:MAG TPA: CapA family protein, partial [Hyalangium sp.]|nr:CapA family protein [Hyalangium sp.]
MPSSVLLLLALFALPDPSADPAVAPVDPAAAVADDSFVRGVEALKARDAKTAIAALSSCVEAAPTRVDCRWELGWAYSLENKWAEALAQWTE